ncbi:MAG: hypothetical protein AVDCRST_MAG85-719, partial [uncultured Solirubrobacteraceae bacterium]
AAFTRGSERDPARAVGHCGGAGAAARTRDRADDRVGQDLRPDGRPADPFGHPGCCGRARRPAAAARREPAGGDVRRAARARGRHLARRRTGCQPPVGGLRRPARCGRPSRRGPHASDDRGPRLLQRHRRAHHRAGRHRARAAGDQGRVGPPARPRRPRPRRRRAGAGARAAPVRAGRRGASSFGAGRGGARAPRARRRGARAPRAGRRGAGAPRGGRRGDRPARARARGAAAQQARRAGPAAAGRTDACRRARRRAAACDRRVHPVAGAAVTDRRGRSAARAPVADRRRRPAALAVVAGRGSGPAAPIRRPRRSRPRPPKV